MLPTRSSGLVSRLHLFWCSGPQSAVHTTQKYTGVTSYVVTSIFHTASGSFFFYSLYSQSLCVELPVNPECDRTKSRLNSRSHTRLQQQPKASQEQVVTRRTDSCSRTEWSFVGFMWRNMCVLQLPKFPQSPQKEKFLVCSHHSVLSVGLLLKRVTGCS